MPPTAGFRIRFLFYYIVVWIEVAEEVLGVGCVLTLVTFADSRLKHSANRLKRQATKIGSFQRILTFDEKSLDKAFGDFHQQILSPSVRGFGFWIWKPQVILQALREIDYGEVLVYLDVGCHINFGGAERLEEYFQIVRQSDSGILAFQLQVDGETIYRECEWTKGDVFEVFGTDPYGELAQQAQIEATVIFVHKREQSVQFVRRWLELMAKNPGLCDDSVSIAANHPDFVDHRHDQSFFSLLGKAEGISLLSFAETFPVRRTLVTRRPAWHDLNKMPIHAKRDKMKFIEHLIADLVGGFKFVFYLRFIRRIVGQ